MVTDSHFHPYKVLSQSGSTLQLKAGGAIKILRFVFLLAPLLMLGMGAFLYATDGDIKLLYIFGGVALLELVIFFFIHFPGDLQLDRMGLTVQQVSIRGSKQVDYLWTDVDRIRQRIESTKNGKSLAYDAMLKTGKRFRFLYFGTYDPKQQSVEDINALLRQISQKEIEVKA